MEDHTNDFKTLVKNSGIPVTEDEALTKWQSMLDAQGSVVNNESSVSPFWRLVFAIVTQPLLWLVNLIVTQWMPNSYVKTAGGVFLDILAYGVNIIRKPAIKARGTLLFSRADTAGVLVVPAGTVVESPPINGTVYRLITLQEGSFVDGEAQISVTAEAENTGKAFNLAAGYYAILPTPIAGITAVINDVNWLGTPGADIEEDEDLRERVRNQFGAVNQWHINAGYLALVTTFAGVNIRNIFIDSDAPRGPGTANFYILLDIGEPSQNFLDDIQNYIMVDGNHGLGDDVNLFSMPGTDHDLVVDVWPFSGLTALKKSALALDVEQMVRAAFRENTDYSPTVTVPSNRFSFSVLGKELHDQFTDIEDLSLNLASITSDWNVPRLNTLLVNIHA